MRKDEENTKLYGKYQIMRQGAKMTSYEISHPPHLNVTSDAPVFLSASRYTNITKFEYSLLVSED